MLSLTHIHIGKTGGGSIIDILKNKKLIINEKEYKFAFDIDHQKKLVDKNGKYIFYIRDPVSRFISAFIYVMVFNSLLRRKRTT